MNDKVLRHKAICDELNKLYERKNHDYGDTFHQTFIEEGFAMARIRLSDKFGRFKTLSRHCGSIENLLRKTTNGDTAKVLVKDQQVTDESIRDTLIDLANYAIMTVLEMDDIAAAEKRRKDIDRQFSDSKYAVTHGDETEHKEAL